VLLEAARMKIELTPQQEEYRNEFRIFVDAEIVPHASRFDEEEPSNQ